MIAAPEIVARSVAGAARLALRAKFEVLKLATCRVRVALFGFVVKGPFNWLIDVDVHRASRRRRRRRPAALIRCSMARERRTRPATRGRGEEVEDREDSGRIR